LPIHSLLVHPLTKYFSYQEHIDVIESKKSIPPSHLNYDYGRTLANHAKLLILSSGGRLLQMHGSRVTLECLAMSEHVDRKNEESDSKENAIDG